MSKNVLSNKTYIIIHHTKQNHDHQKHAMNHTPIIRPNDKSLPELLALFMIEIANDSEYYDELTKIVSNCLNDDDTTVKDLAAYIIGSRQ